MCDPNHPKRFKEDASVTNSNLEENSSDLRLLLDSYTARKSENIPGQNQTVENAITKPNGVSPLIIDQVRNLPIYFDRDELIKLIQENQVVVVKGETGSGKSTQIPKYLVSAGYSQNGKRIAITQPRRVAAKSLAERVARETGTEVGKLIGYAVRFDKCVSDETIIKFVTDGLLIKEATSDPLLSQYSVVMIDEAHERSIHTDLACGLLKRICKARPDFRVILSSATLEEQTFSEYFDNAPVYNVAGRTFPVEIIYDPKPPGFYLDGVSDTVIKICQTETQGDILVFLAGMDDIGAVSNTLSRRLSSVTGALIPIIVECHASLPFEEQQKMFDKTPDGRRKIILATNIAETTLTIVSMDFVVDCGYFKQTHFDSSTQIGSLIKQRITKFQAIQRAGRAGRTRPGKCYRLYSENEMSSFLASPIPEIQRYNVQYVILDIIAMGFENPLDFEFITKPSVNIIKEAMTYLTNLSALDETGNITEMGKVMGKFPVEPQLAKVLIKSVENGCAPEVLKIAAMLCSQYMNIFDRQRVGNNIKSDSRILQFTINSDGDHLTLLKVYNGWEANEYNDNWCTRNLIVPRFLQEAKDIRQQFQDILTGSGFEIPENGETGINISSAKKLKILETFASGFFFQIAKKCSQGHAYKIVSDDPVVANQLVFLHPSGALFSKRPAPSLIMFHDILKTSKAFARGTSEIQPSMLVNTAPRFAP